MAFLEPLTTTGFAYTVAVGQNVWLLGVRVWFAPKSWPDGGVRFKIVTGFEKPASFAEIECWDNILPLLHNGIEDWAWLRHAEFDPMEWSMNQHFSGIGRRLGVHFTISGTVTALYLMVSFEISEG